MAARLTRLAAAGSPSSAARGDLRRWLCGRRATAARRLGATALVAAVVLAHWGITARLSDSLVGWGDAESMQQRLSAVFTRELQAAAPVPVVQAPPPRGQPTVAQAPEPAASQPQRRPRRRPPEPAPRDEAVPEVRAEAPPPAPSTADPAAAGAAASGPDPLLAQSGAAASSPTPAVPEVATAALPAAAAASAAAFEWPASTQLTYRLTGWYRGELYGTAQVQWIRDGEHYQVHLDVVIGLPFAPMMTRRMTSDGELTDQGLRPRRYDEETRVGLAARRLLTIRFEAGRVVLPGGQTVEGWAAVQDSASQFVQLTWMFTLKPQLLRPGGTVDLALALPRYVDRWVFDVLGEETLYAPFGEVQAVHIKPRRQARPGIDRTAEVWIAPQLQYLPVRIRIWQDEQTYIDLMIERPPLQALPQAGRR